jgi:methionyl-tRNA formyltransferase
MCAMTDPAGDRPARLVLVSGHEFGLRAFQGVFSSAAFLAGQVEVPLMIGLDRGHAAATVGYRPLAGLAAEQRVAHVDTADGRLTSLAGRIRAACPDYILVIGWSRLLPEEILSIPAQVTGGGPGRCGCIGMHPTRLPVGRGQAPIPWTIIKGCASTALSVFFLEAGPDSGPVIAQYGLDVRPRETAASLFYRVAAAHFTAGEQLAGQLAAREVPAVTQDQALASRWPKRRPADGEIRPEMTGAQIDALVRALLGPYPRAFVVSCGQRRPVGRVWPGSCPPAPGPAGDWIGYECSDGKVYLHSEC